MAWPAGYNNQGIASFENYNDMIQNPEGYPNALQNLERFEDNRFTQDEEIPGYNFRDEPTSFRSRLTNPQFLDNPNTGWWDNKVMSRGNPQKSLVNRMKSGITGILDNTILGRIAGGFDATNPRSGNFNPMLEGQLDLAKGGIDEGGLGWGVDDIGRFTSGPLTGQASMSGFGTNDITAQLRARKQKIATRKIAQTAWSRKQQAEIQAAIDAQVRAENKGYRGTPGGNTGSGAFARVDNTGKTYGPYTGWEGKGGGQGNKGNGNKGSSGGAPGTGMHRARGGRIGYALAGPVGVEQETDFIQGPQGTDEFQETVVEGQAQPSREQLEALAMEIFQLPLEELDDQQLLVVYQEAMQGQPMEEAVQEEDVQFAANGGLAGLL